MGLAQSILRNPLLLLLVGAVLIVAAVILVWLNISTRSVSVDAASQTNLAAEAETSTTPILIAARAIERGAIIAPEDVKLHGIVAPVPSGSFTSAPAAIGRVATVNILPSQLILNAHPHGRPSCWARVRQAG